jgi:hypothetical protein
MIRRILDERDRKQALSSQEYLSKVIDGLDEFQLTEAWRSARKQQSQASRCVSETAAQCNRQKRLEVRLSG